MLRKLTYRIAAATAWLGLALAPAGCSKSDAPAPDEGREVTLSFRIATQLPPTRAEIVATEEGLADENWVNIPDARFLLFTRGGVLLQELRPTLDEQAADYATYTVKATIREPYFDYAVDNGSVRFRIMVLANWPAAALNAIAGCTTESEIEAKAAETSAMWTMPDENWMPKADDSGIPMYGLKEFTVTTDALRQSDENSPAGLTDEINLLRALAKLEVIDNIQTKNGAGYPRIQSVTLLGGGYYTLARLIPDGFRDSEQVTAPTLPAAPVLATADRALAERNYTTEQTPGGAYTFKGWTTYLPEMQFNTNNALRVVVENDPDYVGKTGTNGATIPATYTATILMPDADGMWDGCFLRNHIYRLEVVSAGTDMKMQYTYTICPWIERSTDITFD